MSSQPSQPARDLALIAVFAGVTAALGLIPPLYVPISPVPISVNVSRADIYNEDMLYMLCYSNELYSYFLSV